MAAEVTAPPGAPAAPTAPTTPTTLPGAPPGRGFAKGGFRPGAFGIGGLGGLGGGGGIHGEFVRPSGTGYQTVDTQVGGEKRSRPESRQRGRFATPNGPF